jgi:rare lipoprotein A (peptidoglycan hydrolase)
VSDRPRDPGIGAVALAVILAVIAINIKSHDHATTTSVVATELTKSTRRVDALAMYGWASWYGVPFHGRKTADGTVYDMGGYSVANRTMKLGTFVRITSMRTGLSCIAIVNDRGPYIEGRDWDLSRAVALRLKAVWHGVIPVKVEEIR